MNIDPQLGPRLGHWLAAAARGIAIEPTRISDTDLDVWAVEIHNGLEGEDRESSVVAFCFDEIHAELVATALWSLTADVRSGEKADAPVTLPGDHAIERLLETVAGIEDAHGDEPKPKWRNRR